MNRTNTIAAIRTQIVRMRPAVRLLLDSDDAQERERGADIIAAIIFDRAIGG